MSILKKILMGVGLLVAGLVALVLIVWFFPQIVINNGTVKWAVGKQSVIQFEPAFPGDFNIEVRNSRMVRQRVKISAGKFCIKTTDASLNACFDQFDFETVINFKDFSLMFDSIGPITIISSSVEYASIEKKNEQKEEDQGEITYLGFSEEFELNKIIVIAPKISIDTGESKVKANIDLHGEAPEKNSPYLLNLKANANSDRDPQVIKIDLASTLDQSSEIAGKLIAYAGSKGKTPSVNLNAEFSGNLLKVIGKLEGNLKIEQLAPMLPLVDVYKFKLIKDEKLSFDADFRTELMVGYSNEPRKSALPPPKFKTKFEGKIVAEQSAQQPIHFNVKINPSRQYGLIAQAKTKGQYNLKSSTLDLETLLLDLKIEDFRETVRGLKKTQMAIPAPINDLRGKIHLLVGAEKLEQSKNGTFSIPIDFSTNLTSTQQSLVINAKGKTNINPTPFSGSLDLNVNLNDIAIQLPDFDPISKFPTVVGDSRFVTKEEKVSRKEVFDEKKSEPSNFVMNINVDTPQKPIRFMYKLFEPAAMFRVQTQIKGQSSDFNITAEPFVVSFLKRTARLERLKITNDEKAKSIKLDGRFSIKKADYLIYVDIEQEAKQSYVTLTSEPPLSEEDIVSLILFNELASTLDSTSNDSVQDTQAAMTKKTIGFLSFFVLASTPIESVSYDPTTQQYSARVKLPGGFTGTVGSDWENSQQVGLRRRLGGKFVISAGVGTNSDGDQRQETMIEWYHRY